MSRSAPDRWPISSERAVKSGICWRDRMPRRTRSAASASLRTGSAMVLASNSDSTSITVASTRKTRSSAQRSEAITESMSPPRVERSNAPRIAPPARWIGAATETIVSSAASTRTADSVRPANAAATSGIDLPLVAHSSAARRFFAGVKDWRRSLHTLCHHGGVSTFASERRAGPRTDSVLESSSNRPSRS